MTAEQGGQNLVIPDAIRMLLERRAQYMEWLTKLDDLGGRYRPEVAKRVRADYRDRLTGVEDELHGHREELESSLSQRKKQLSEFEQRHEICAAELEEAELRHQVGEFDEGEWENRKQAHERELADVARALDVEREAVAELGAVLLQVTSPSEAAATRHVEPGAWSEPGAANLHEPVVEAPIDEGNPTDALESAVDVLGELAAVVEGSVEAPSEEEKVEEFVEAEPVEEFVEAEPVEEEFVEAEPVEGEWSEPEKPIVGKARSGDGDEFLDELEFLESLSLDDPESFDAVSRMLEEEGEAPPEGDGSDRGGAG
jgi:hypothetical protein